MKWPAYSQSLRQRFEETHFGQYERETRELAESQGLVRARQRYNPIDFEWFVLYQFGGMTSTAIADRYAAEGQGSVVERLRNEVPLRCRPSGEFFHNFRHEGFGIAEQH